MEEIEKIKKAFWSSIKNELKLAIFLSSPKINQESPDLAAIDAGQFMELVERHRLLPSLMDKTDILRKIPSLNHQDLKQKIIEHRKRALLQTGELMRLSKILDEKKIVVIALKGTAMAQELYNDVTQRLSRDIDLLVSESDLEKCHEIFKKLNYNPKFEFSPRQRKYLLNHSHHFSYFNAEQKILVELHWRLFPNKFLFPGSVSDILEHASKITVGSSEIKTLCPDHLIFYLSLHGGYHLWFRLHWIRDIAQIISRCEINWEDIRNKAEIMGIQKPVAESMMLAHIIYHADIPKPFQGAPFSKWSIHQSLNEIIKEPHVESNRAFKKIIRTTRVIFHLRKSFPHRISILPLMNTRSSDWKQLKLPDGLFFLYFFLHPFFWLFYKRKKNK